ncbi:MAG: hypothetical protein D6785_07805 [Planctomycetota bacterium]|nr:MAG: hypothetical protein D6785_07805 [Planctomycetota bacterium]
MPTIPSAPNIQVSTSGALNAAVVRNSFFRSLQREGEQRKPYLDLLFITAKKSEGIQETYAQIADNVIWRRWPKGQPRIFDAGKEFFYTIVNHEYQAGIHFHKNDRADDRTGTFVRQIDSAARNYYSLFNDIAIQLLEGQVNPDLLPSIPNSYYGISLISAAHTFVAGGNVVAGSGTTAAQIETDIYTVLARFRNMKQEGKSYPYWGPNEVAIQSLVFIIPPGLESVFETLQKNAIIADPGGVAAGVTNKLMNRINYFVDTRLTDANDWYAILNADPNIKPFVRVPREDIQVVQESFPNDSYSKQTGYEYYAASARWGFSVYEPRSIVKVTNV